MSDIYDCPVLDPECPYLDCFGTCSDPYAFHECDFTHDLLEDDLKSLNERM